MMKHILIFVALCGVYGQRQLRPMVEFTETMEQCGDLRCNISQTCDFRNATCMGRPCLKVACVPILRKEGRCPAPPSVLAIGMDCDTLAEFLPDCYEDNHCSGTQKCCPGRCRFKECQNAIFKKKTATVRLGTSTRRTNTSPAPVLLLAGGGRAREAHIDKAIAPANRHSKPGSCPSTKANRVNGLCSFLQNMIPTCKTDRDCSGDRKCCPGRCGLQCTMALFNKANNNNKNAKNKANAAAKTTVTGSAGRPVRTNGVNRTISTPSDTKSPATVVPSIVISRPSNRKPGACPPIDQAWSFLCPHIESEIVVCQNDAACPEVQKCCPGRCSLKECRIPLLSRENMRSLFLQDAPDRVPDRPDSTRVAPSVASCPVITLTPTQTSGANLSYVDMLVCTIVHSTQPKCKQHSQCTGRTMCCKTRCNDYRCVNPVLS